MSVFSDIAARLDGMGIGGGVFLGRALEPALRADLTAAVPVAGELPFVRGETVLPDDLMPDDVVVVGHPNYLGGFDPVAGPHRTLVVYDPTLGAHREIHGASAVVTKPGAADVAATGVATTTASYLARRLSQIGTVQPAFAPRSPVLIVLLPYDPRPVAERVESGTALGSDYPELPGGLRIEVPVAMAEIERRAYAAELETVIIEMGSS